MTIPQSQPHTASEEQWQMETKCDGALWRWTQESFPSAKKWSLMDALTRQRIQEEQLLLPIYLTSGSLPAMTRFSLVWKRFIGILCREIEQIYINILDHGDEYWERAKWARNERTIRYIANEFDLFCWFDGVSRCAGELTILPPDCNGDQPVACVLHRGMIESLASEYSELEYR